MDIISQILNIKTRLVKYKFGLLLCFINRLSNNIICHFRVGVQGQNISVARLVLAKDAGSDKIMVYVMRLDCNTSK